MMMKQHSWRQLLIVIFRLHCTTKSGYKKDMQYVQYKHIVGYNDQSKLCTCTRHAERWQVLAATKLKIYQNIWLICTMFFVSVYMSVNNSQEYCLISTINHTGRGCCQSYWPHLVLVLYISYSVNFPFPFMFPLGFFSCSSFSCRTVLWLRCFAPCVAVLVNQRAR